MTGEAGGTTGRRRVAALVGALALVLGACGGDDAAPAATEASTPTTGPEPELATAPTTWDDGYDHVVVLTENAVTGGADDEVQEPVLDEPSSADEAERVDAEAPTATSTTEPATTAPHDAAPHARGTVGAHQRLDAHARAARRAPRRHRGGRRHRHH